jgi:hypothetical protein
MVSSQRCGVFDFKAEIKAEITARQHTANAGQSKQ